MKEKKNSQEAKMSNNSGSSSNSNGTGFFSLLTIAFIVLKLTKVIDWSWWLVLLPFYGSIIFGLLIVGLIFLGVCLTDK